MAVMTSCDLKQKYKLCLDEILFLNGEEVIQRCFKHTNVHFYSSNLEQLRELTGGNKLKTSLLLSVLRIIFTQKLWWSDSENKMLHHPHSDRLNRDIQRMLPKEYHYDNWIYDVEPIDFMEAQCD